MNLEEAIEQARKRWGKDGFVSYTVGSKQIERVLGTSGKSWEDAFSDADAIMGSWFRPAGINAVKLPWDMPISDVYQYVRICEKSPEERSSAEDLAKKYVELCIQATHERDLNITRAQKAENAFEVEVTHIENAIKDLLLVNVEDGFFKPEIVNRRLVEAFGRGISSQCGGEPFTSSIVDDPLFGEREGGICSHPKTYSKEYPDMQPTPPKDNSEVNPEDYRRPSK